MKKHNKRRNAAIILIFAAAILFSSQTRAQQMNEKYYDMGTPVLTEIWVDPVHGNDSNTGSSRGSAFLTIQAAWNSLPANVSATGYRINLTTGNYFNRDSETNYSVGLYLDNKHGTFSFPIIISAVDGDLTVHVHYSFDFANISYVYLMGIDFPVDTLSYGGGNTVHFANGNHILIKNCKVSGFDGITQKAQETVKVNQIQYFYLENSDVSGAFWFPVDFVAVQYGHIQGCKIHDAGMDGLLLKGGTAQIRVEDNTIYNTDRFGFSAGQGAGFDFMVVPWLHYEAYDLKFINNIIYNTKYSGIAVLGVYNILIAYNTIYKAGIDNNDYRHLITFSLGQRGCDGVEIDTCNSHHTMGGWSPGIWSSPPFQNGLETDCIPNKNIYVYNNIFYNPGKDSTSAGHFEIRAPYEGVDLSSNFLQSCNIPKPSLSDDNLQIKGNIIWNGSVNKSLGIDETTGGQDSNPTCNAAQLLRDNSINVFEPQFVDASQLNFHPVLRGNIFSAVTYVIPDFTGTDKPSRPIIPTGNLANAIMSDYDGHTRTSSDLPGAFNNSTSVSITNNSSNYNSYRLEQNYPNPFNPSTQIEFTIKNSSRVKIIIYDLLGREVATLMNEDKAAGTYNVKFNASHLASGVYIYRMTAGDYIATKKMVYLK